MFQLGHDSFWNDEAGQALAAIQPTLRQLFAIERAHAMAMPLDYLVSRGFSHIGLSETVMRFPAVIWGTLTLAVYFALVRRATQAEVSLLATFLLGISAWHVHYSQEMRFYAALVFFYALSTYLLFVAIDRYSFSRWAVFTLVSAVGTYSHPYVLLSLTNGFAYLLVTRSVEQQKKRECLVLIVSAIVITTLFLPGYFYFGSHQRFGYKLLQWSPSIAKGIARGIGWMSLPYSPTVAPFGLWQVLIIGFAFAGLASGIIQRNAQLICLLLGLPTQVALIVLGDWIKGYWFASRQLVHLHPILLVFTAVGAVTTSVLIARLVVPERYQGESPTRRVAVFLSFVLAIVVGLLGLSGAQVLRGYYEWPKSTGRDITSELMQIYRPGELILVIPGHEEKIYRLYFQVSGAEPELTEALQLADWSTLEQAVTCTSVTAYLVTPATLTKEQKTKLQRLGFAK